MTITLTYLHIAAILSFIVMCVIYNYKQGKIAGVEETLDLLEKQGVIKFKHNTRKEN